MQWSNGFDRQPSSNPLKRRRGVWRFLAMSCLAPVVGLVLIVGSCAFVAAVFRPLASVIALRDGADRTPLPRLTPTTLPTLTPTVSPGQGAAGEAVAGSAFSPAAAAPSNGSRAAQSQPSTQGGAVAPPVQPGRTGAASSAYSPAAAMQNNSAGSANPSTGQTASASLPVPTAPPAVGQPGNEVVIILPTTSPPTSTPTARPSPTKTPAPAPTATALPVDSVLDDDSGSDDEEEETGESINWSFSGVRADTSQYQNGMLVYGNLINHSAAAQEIELVNATFYDTGGNIIGEENHIQAYWPAYAVPPAGASMPFQLLVNGLSGAADFDLNLEAAESSSMPRVDFEFSDLEESYQSNSYCVDGHLHNGGSQVQDYLIIAVVLYDEKDNVINFQDEQVYNPSQVVGDQAYHFKICVAPPYDDVARYDVQAWGY